MRMSTALSVIGFAGFLFAGTTTAAFAGVAEDIKAGRTFTVRFSALPDGNVGTIYNGRFLVGVYNDPRHAWRVSGPNGTDGHNVSAEYCPPPSCPSGNPAIDPVADHLIELWGAQFSFDGNGSVFLKGTSVEVGQVVIATLPNICTNRQDRLVPPGGTQCILHDVHTCKENGNWSITSRNAC